MNSNEKIRYGKFLKNIAFLLFGALLFASIFYFSKISLAAVAHDLQQIPFGYYLLLLWMYATILFVVSHRWSIIVKGLLPGRVFNRGFFFYALTLSHLASLLPINKAGDIGTKLFCLKMETDASLMDGFLSTLMESLLSLYVYSVMAITAMIYLFQCVPNSFIVFLGLLLIPISFYFFVQKFDWIFKGILGLMRILDKATKHIFFIKSKNSLESASASLLNMDKQIIRRSLSYTLVFYFMTAIKCYLLAVALRMDVGFIPFLITYPIILLVSAIGVTPSGLGITEIGWIGLLTYLGIDHEQAALYAVIKRIFDYSSLFVISLTTYLSYTFYDSKERRVALSHIVKTLF